MFQYGSYIGPFITGDGGKHCIGGACESGIIVMNPWGGIGMGTIMTPYSEYEYGGVAGCEDLGRKISFHILYLRI